MGARLVVPSSFKEQIKVSGLGGRIDSGLHNVQFSHRVSSFQSDLEIDISSFCWYNYYT